MTVVAVCTPHGGGVDPQYYRAVLTMQGNFTQYQFLHVEVDTIIVGKARNMLAEVALANGADILWYIDNDVMIPAHAGVLIDNALKLGVVSGVYYNRHLPFTPQVFNRATELENAGLYWPDIDIPTEGIVKRDAVGAGCLLITSDVMKQLQTKWQERVIPDFPNADIVRKLSPWFEFLDRKGEDLYFCERLAEIGIDIWVNCEVVCYHLTQVPIGREHFQYMIDSGRLQLQPTGGGEIDLIGQPVEEVPEAGLQ